VVRKSSPIERGRPSYNLAEFQKAMSEGNCYISGSARQGIMALEFDSRDVVACVAGLAKSNFEKSTPARDKGNWRDVYATVHLGVRVYIKITRSTDGRFVLESFKRNTNED